MPKVRLEGSDADLLYEESEGGILVLGVEGNPVRLEIPARIGEKPVTQIRKKAFFDSRFLRFAVLPATMEKIDSWAFAHCRQLERVELPQKPIALGRDIFIGSKGLQKIVLYPTKSEGQPQRGKNPGEVLGGGEGISRLLAVAVTKLGDPFLLRIEEAGTKEWLEKWDARMLVRMREDDNDGYDKQVLAGEEDYERTDPVRFRNLKRRAKVRLAFVRLCNSCGLCETVRKELEEYLKNHTKGCRSEETWEVVLGEFGDDREYYGLFAQLGCVTEENFEGLLEDIGERHTEMKAYFMRYKEQHLGHRDFFAGLSLDF